MSRIRYIACLILIAIIIVAACSPSPQGEIATVPTIMELPTLAPADFTPSPTPTDTLVPTNTLVPTAPPTARPYCDYDAYWEIAGPSTLEFLDIMRVAGNVDATSLPPLIIELQRTRREFQRLDIAECAEEAHGYIDQMMTHVVENLNRSPFERNTLDDVSIAYLRGIIENLFAAYFLLQYTDARTSLIEAFGIMDSALQEDAYAEAASEFSMNTPFSAFSYFGAGTATAVAQFVLEAEASATQAMANATNAQVMLEGTRSRLADSATRTTRADEFGQTETQRAETLGTVYANATQTRFFESLTLTPSNRP